MKKFDYEEIRFFSSSDIQNFSVSSLDFFPPVFEICILRVHRKILKRKCFFFDKFIFLVLGFWPSYFWSFTQKLFVTLVKTAFEVFRRTIWWKFNVLRKLGMFHHFPTCNEKSYDFLVKNSVIFVRFALARPSYISRKSFFWNYNIFSLSFFTSTNLFYNFPQHFSVRASRTDLYLPEDHFKEKHLVWAICFEISTVPGFEPNNCRTSGDNCSAALSN